MGICYQGKTLKEAVDEKERLFKETGRAYGLEKLELVEGDPAKLMRFQMRLVAACIGSRETAMMISANPMSVVQGELLFMLANAEGDVASASYGLAGHFQSFPYIVRSIANLNFEENPEIRRGDIFATNDPYYGAPHTADNYTWVPIFYKDELIGWTVGMNHIVDVGGIQPGGFGMISPNVFTDGFLYPPTRTGTNFRQHKWWELYWKRKTRAETFNILDDKMRVAGAVALHDRVLEVIEEFGIEYYRQAIREIIERERRELIRRIQSMAVPGIYHWLHFSMVRYKGVVGKLFPRSDRNWFIHMPAEFQVLGDGRLHTDLTGLTSEGEFHLNTYEPAVRMSTTMGAWPMFAHAATINSAMMYMTDWKIPPGSMFNPQNPFAGTMMGLAYAAKYQMIYSYCLSYAFFARGYLEECYSQDSGGVAYGLAGILADGFQWAGGDMTLMTCTSPGGLPYKDGDHASGSPPNPASDMGEVEVGEFLQPTQLNLGRVLVPNHCAHGKYRSGLGIGTLQMIVDPGQSLVMAAYGSSSGMGNMSLGRCGGYPAPNDLNIIAHDTNIRQLLAEGKPYPTHYVEMMEWIRDGKLKAGEVEIYQRETPNIQLKDGDLYAAASGCKGAWGDVLERDLRLVERDVKYGWITKDVAEMVYGAVIGDDGKVKEAESAELRKRMRDERKAKSVPAKDWWKSEREMVCQKAWQVEEVYDMFADGLKYDKFRREFMKMWQLPDDYEL